MGRGTSKGGGGGGSTSVDYITNESGDVLIDLTQIPLIYGQKDSALSQAERASIEAFENKRYKYKTEYGYAIDENGDLIGNEVHGGKGSVRVPTRIMTQAKTFSHNHPRGKGEEGLLGGTFSDQDLRTFSKNNNLKTMRATALEGTYSISKGANFDSRAFNSFAQSVSQKHMATIKSTYNSLYKQASNGKLSRSEYYSKCHAAFNKGMVAIHNDMLGGQKQFGYFYTLEKRG
jgi:hypothetical protein